MITENDLVHNEKKGEFWNMLQKEFLKCHEDDTNDPFTQLETIPESVYVLSCIPLHEVIDFLIERNFEIKIEYKKDD